MVLPTVDIEPQVFDYNNHMYSHLLHSRKLYRKDKQAPLPNMEMMQWNLLNRYRKPYDFRQKYNQ